MTWHELVEAVRPGESSGVELKRGELKRGELKRGERDVLVGR